MFEDPIRALVAAPRRELEVVPTFTLLDVCGARGDLMRVTKTSAAAVTAGTRNNMKTFVIGGISVGASAKTGVLGVAWRGGVALVLRPSQRCRWWCRRRW